MTAMSKERMGNIVATNLQAVLPDSIKSGAVLTIRRGRIVGLCSTEEFSSELLTPDYEFEFHDFGGDIVIPGLIDLHVHGCGGSDTMDASAAALDNMASSLLQLGTTAFLATTMSASASRLRTVFTLGETFRSAEHQSELLGFHMEGPCISSTFHGAQDVSEISEFTVPVTNAVKILTLAPENPAAKQYIEMAKTTGIVLSAGHSGASYEQMKEAIEAGVHHLTHAFNAMPGIHHRLPGLISAALLDHRVTIELIADGIHVHPAVIEMALRLKGPDRVILVSDGTRAVGMPDGDYDLGGQPARLQQGKMTLQDGTIAGSAMSLLAGVRFVVAEVGRPLWEAVRMASFNPARLMKLDHIFGSLNPGMSATFLRLAPDLTLKEVWIKGRCCFASNEHMKDEQKYV